MVFASPTLALIATWEAALYLAYAEMFKKQMLIPIESTYLPEAADIALDVPGDPFILLALDVCSSCVLREVGQTKMGRWFPNQAPNGFVQYSFVVKEVRLLLPISKEPKFLALVIRFHVIKIEQ